MKTKRGTSYNKARFFEYEMNGKEYTVQGDLYYNRKKQRYEHTHIGPRGGETLIFWTVNEYHN